MPVTRYRSIEEMPRPWMDRHRPENHRLAARMAGGATRQPGFRRLRSRQEADAGRDDPCGR